MNRWYVVRDTHAGLSVRVCARRSEAVRAASELNAVQAEQDRAFAHHQAVVDRFGRSSR